jgi:putative endonuclease
MTNNSNSVLYVGITNNLVRRVYEHKNKINSGFTNKYNLYKLVYFDYSGDVNAAIAHEKRVKKWRRQWKLDLITKFNPTWEDLYNKISG